VTSPASEAIDFATEIGSPGNIKQAWQRLNNRAILEAASSDPNPDLECPESALGFKQLLRTDGQGGAVIRAITNSITKAAWTLDESGCTTEVADFVRENIGLPRDGEVLPRNRVSTVLWPKHLREALSCLVYGFSVFEQTYMASRTDGTLRVHLRKLAARLQTTVSRIEVARDGGLEAVYQRADPNVTPINRALGPGVMEVRIPVDRLALYSHEREGADWYGVSVLRSAYKHWRVNDVMIRLAAQIIERNGMGIPGMEYDGVLVTKREAEQAVAEWRAGATAGLVYPKGAMPVLKGVEGSTPDPLPLIKYNDEAIGRSVLAMFLNLGHDNGARSLGETFVDAFTDSLQAVADFVAETATTYIIADLVALNWGEDEPYPILTPGSLRSQAGASAEDLKLLTESGLLVADEAARTWARDTYGLPEADDPTDDGVPDPPPAPMLAPGLAAVPDPDAEQVAAALSERVSDYVRRVTAH